MAKNVKFGPDISCRKTGFRLKKLKVQPGNKLTLNAWYHEIVTIIFTI